MKQLYNFIGLLFFIVFPALFASLFSQTFPIRSYSVDEGLPTSIVYDATQDSSGIIWVSTELGVSRYNGKTWENFSDKDGIERTNYIRVLTDEQNQIWALPLDSRFCISFFDGLKWNKIKQVSFQSWKSVFTSFAIKNYKNSVELLIGSSEGLYFYKDNQWKKILDEEKKLNCDIFDIKLLNNKFLIASKNGLFIYDNNHFENITNIISKKSQEVLALDISGNPAPNKKNQKVVWVLTRNSFGYFDPISNYFTTLRETNPLKFLPRNKFVFIKYDRKYKVYLGNETSRFSFDLRSNKFLNLDMENGFSSTGNSNLFVDKEENIWFLSTRGIDKLSNPFFSNYGRATGFEEDEVASIKEISPTKFFIGHNYGFTIFSNGKATYQSIENLLPTNSANCRIIDAVTDGNGNVWFSAGSLGIGMLNNNGELKWYRNNNNEQFGAIALNKKGIVICSSNKRLYSLVNERLIPFPTKIDNQSLIRKLLITKDNKIIASSATGLFLFNDKYELIKRYSDKNQFNNLFGLCEFENKILVGKKDGLFVINEDHLDSYLLGNQEITQKVYFIEKDKKGKLWLGTDDGVIIWDGKKAKKLSKENGLIGRETNRSGFCSDSFGNVWIGTERGLSCYSPDYDTNQIIPTISNISISDNQKNLYSLNNHSHNELQLNYSQNTITLQFNALSFINEEKIQCSVFLQGFDKQPIVIKYKEPIRYTNLAPGSYQFIIRAKNANGEWSKEFYSAKFVINPPFHRTWWFRILSILILMGALIWVNSYFYQKKHSTKLEQEVKLRTAELMASEERIRTIVQHAPFLIIMIDKEFTIKFINISIPPFSIDNSVGKKLTEYFANNDYDHITNQLQNLFNNKIPILFEYNFNHILGKNYWLECHLNPIILSEQVEEAIGIFIDRTTLKQAEADKLRIDKERNEAYELIKKSLKEKETLLNEVYHRVGNNLQVISSLMNLQAMHVDNKALSALFNESINRIKSMSLVHEKLYQSKNLDHINFAEYITSLVNYLSERYNYGSVVQLQLELNDTAIKVDKAISVGLIVNELLSNAFKYGAVTTNKQKMGPIMLKATIADSNIILYVKDTGPGLHENFTNIQSGKTLGMRLINLLTSQLSGTLNYEYEEGAKFTVTFPLTDYNDDKK